MSVGSGDFKSPAVRRPGVQDSQAPQERQRAERPRTANWPKRRAGARVRRACPGEILRTSLLTKLSEFRKRASGSPVGTRKPDPVVNTLVRCSMSGWVTQFVGGPTWTRTRDQRIMSQFHGFWPDTPGRNRSCYIGAGYAMDRDTSGRNCGSFLREQNVPTKSIQNPKSKIQNPLTLSPAPPTTIHPRRLL